MSILCVGQLVADIVVRPVGGLPRPGTTDLVADLQLTAGGLRRQYRLCPGQAGGEDGPGRRRRM